MEIGSRFKPCSLTQLLQASLSSWFYLSSLTLINLFKLKAYLRLMLAQKSAQYYMFISTLSIYFKCIRKEKATKSMAKHILLINYR